MIEHAMKKMNRVGPSLDFFGGGGRGHGPSPPWAPLFLHLWLLQTNNVR